MKHSTKNALFSFMGILFSLSLLLTACNSGGGKKASTDSTDNLTAALYPNQEVVLGKGGGLDLTALFESGGKEQRVNSQSDTLTWESSDSSVVSVDDSGILKGVSTGSTTVQVSVTISGRSTTQSIGVQVTDTGTVRNITVSPKLVMMAQGESKTLNVDGADAQGNPTTISASEIRYTSSNTAVLNVEILSTGQPKLTAGSTQGFAFITTTYQGISGQPVKVYVAENTEVEKGSTASLGKYSALFVSEDNNVHVSYYNETEGTLKYAYWDESQWTVETVAQAETDDLNAGRESKIIVVAGIPYVSFYETVSQHIQVRARVEGKWSVPSTIESSGQTGPQSAFGIYETTPVLAYAYDNSSVKFASRSSSGWSTTTVSSSYLSGSGVDLKATGSKIGITYIDANKRISYQESTDGGKSWSAASGLSVIASASTIEASGDTALNLDSQGVPHITYYVEGGGIQFSQPVTSALGSEWGTTVLDDAAQFGGKYLGATLDAQGQDRMSYYDQQNGNLRMVRYNAHRKEFDKSFTADDGGSQNHRVGEYSSIGVNSYGQSIISYYNASTKKLHYYVEPYNPN